MKICEYLLTLSLFKTICATALQLLPYRRFDLGLDKKLLVCGFKINQSLCLLLKKI